MANIQHLVDLDLNRNQLLNAVIQNLAVAPTAVAVGQVYFDTALKTLRAWNGTAWLDLGSDGITNLGYTASVSQGTVSSDTGSNAIIPLADATNAGLMSASEKTKVASTSGTNSGDNAVNTRYSGLVSNVTTNLSEGTTTTETVNVNSSDGSNATLASASATRAGLLTAGKFSEIQANTLKVSDINHNVSTNISVVEAPTNVSVQSSDGSNGTIDAANTTNAGVMTALMFNQHTANNAKVSDINHNVSTNLGITKTATTNTVTSSDGNNATITEANTSSAGLMTKVMFDQHVLNNAKVSNVAETLTSLGLASNILKYTDENGNITNLDLSLYLDDTNLARLTSGTLEASNGLATFIRDDGSKFTIDMSALLDAITLNNTLTSSSTTEGLTAAQGKVLKGLIDGLVRSTGTNTGDELQATTTVAGISEIATQAEVDAGTDAQRIVTPLTLKNTLGITGTLSTTLTYSQLVGGSTSQVITHSIGNRFVQVSVYEVAGMDKVVCEVELTSVTTVTLKFNSAPAANSLRVVITG
jgi:hypothetical protein